MLVEAYDGDDALQWSATNGDNEDKIAEHLTVRDGQILASEIVVDSVAFMALMTG